MTQTAQAFAHPIPPDFTLDSGLVITHYTEQTAKGIRLRAEPLETIRRLSADERADYTAQLVNWMNRNGYLLERIRKMGREEACLV